MFYGWEASIHKLSNQENLNIANARGKSTCLLLTGFWKKLIQSISSSWPASADRSEARACERHSHAQGHGRGLRMGLHLSLEGHPDNKPHQHINGAAKLSSLLVSKSHQIIPKHLFAGIFQKKITLNVRNQRKTHCESCQEGIQSFF